MIITLIFDSDEIKVIEITTVHKKSVILYSSTIVTFISVVVIQYASNNFG